MLDDIRVLELSAPETMLAGMMLADLGADVVTLEPPAGSAGRRLDPFIAGIPGIERSLAWHALNRNKRGVTLDLDSNDGRALLPDLAARFDVVLESLPPGGPSRLPGATAGGRVIHCTISPFAESGPKSRYHATDFVVTAAAGALAMTGDPDRAPVPFPVPQAMMEAGAEAAIAVLAALAARDTDGLGQRAHVSARLAGLLAAFGQPIVIGSGNSDAPRTAAALAGVRVPAVYPCSDGFVAVTIAFGSAWGPMTTRLAGWMEAEGCLPAEAAGVDWSSFVTDLVQGRASPASLASFVDGVRTACAAKTKAELGRVARDRGLLLAPAMDMEDIARSPHHRERGLWDRVPVPVAGRAVDIPTRWAQISDFVVSSRRPAPTLSQHSAEVLGSELGLSLTEIQALFVHGIV